MPRLSTRLCAKAFPPSFSPPPLSFSPNPLITADPNARRSSTTTILNNKSAPESSSISSSSTTATSSMRIHSLCFRLGVNTTSLLTHIKIECAIVSSKQPYQHHGDEKIENHQDEKHKKMRGKKKDKDEEGQEKSGFLHRGSVSSHMNHINNRTNNEIASRHSLNNHDRNKGKDEEMMENYQNHQSDSNDDDLLKYFFLDRFHRPTLEYRLQPISIPEVQKIFFFF